MEILKGINAPSDIKKLNLKELAALSGEIREEIISATGKNGGHLSSNLGIVETTVALYGAFDFPRDKLIFDVGHQCYAHKILSGRKDKFTTIRTDGGLSGFCDSTESDYDPFTTGHAGNSVALGLGLCTARDALKEDYYVVVVVGDGSIVNGLNLEAISASTEKPKKFIVILNDNGMSISHNRNGFYKFISKRTTHRGYLRGKSAVKKVFGNSFVTVMFRKTRDFFKRVLNKREYFEKFGFKYVGVIDGNDLKETTAILKRIKAVAENKAVFLHLNTTKGKGYKQAEERSDVYHGVGKNLAVVGGENCSATLGDILCDFISENDKRVVITAGMKDGAGLCAVEKNYPENFFDVGIAEEFAVTYAAGMAKGGLKPVVAIYSTFLQRAYDEIIQDVCLQNLPVVFCVDRAGFVGEDGKTHQGLFDLSYLTHIPNSTVLAPVSARELKSAINYAFSLNSPVFIRYGKNLPETAEGFLDLAPFDGKWKKITDGEDLTVFAVGNAALKVATEFSEQYGKRVAVYSANTVKPLDKAALLSVKTPVITVEENSSTGGFGSAVAKFYSENSPRKVIVVGAEDKFVAHASRESQLSDSGLSVKNLIETAEELFA